MSTAVERFTDSLHAQGVTFDRVDEGSFAAALETAVEPPVVGSPLPYRDLSEDLPNVDLEPTPEQLRAARTGVAPVGLGIAAHGTLVVQSDENGTEPVSLFPERHVGILRASDVVADLAAAIDWLDGEFAAGRTSAVFATGPSATGDMGELVYGVHGPKDVHVLVVEDR